MSLLDSAEVIDAPASVEVDDRDPARFWVELGDNRKSFRPALLAKEILAEQELFDR